MHQEGLEIIRKKYAGRKVEVLGSEYEVIIRPDSTDERLCGSCDWIDRKIYLSEHLFIDKGEGYLEQEKFASHIFRHELTHAFLYESGNTKLENDEESVEWVTRMTERMNDTYKEFIERVYV